jgi:hypothetical protein
MTEVTLSNIADSSLDITTPSSPLSSVRLPQGHSLCCFSMRRGSTWPDCTRAEREKAENEPSGARAVRTLLLIASSNSRSTVERLRILDFLYEATTSGGEVALMDCGIVPTLTTLIESREDAIVLRGLEVVHSLVSASLDLVDEFLKHDILNKLLMIQGRSTDISEVSINVAFEILAARPFLDAQMIQPSIVLMVDLLEKQADHSVMTRLIAFIAFIFHAGGDIPTLIASSQLPAAVSKLVAHEDFEIASSAMSLLYSVSRDFPEVCETVVKEGVHRHLDRFLCDSDEKIARRASAFLSNLLAHKSSKRLL